MNSVLNGKILKMTPYDNIYIGGSPDDSGVSIGSALYGLFIDQKNLICNSSRLIYSASSKATWAPWALRLCRLFLNILNAIVGVFRQFQFFDFRKSHMVLIFFFES